MKVKICCISSIEEAELAIALGASAIGLVAEMPSGPGIIGDDLIQAIAKDVPANISTFLLTSKVKAKDIIAHLKLVNTNTIQIVDQLVEGTYEEIKAELPTINIVQVIHVLDESSIENAVRMSKFVDYILLDSGNPKLEVKELGGTGRVHNWEISKRIREAIEVPIYLAGGLNSGNVKEAIDLVKPYGVDVCSGVRTSDGLDRKKLEAFFKALN